MTQDERIRLGLLERDLEMVQKHIEEMRKENVRLQKELRVARATIDNIGKVANQGHNLVAQLIKRVAKP